MRTPFCPMGCERDWGEPAWHSHTEPSRENYGRVTLSVANAANSITSISELSVNQAVQQPYLCGQASCMHCHLPCPSSHSTNCLPSSCSACGLVGSMLSRTCTGYQYEVHLKPSRLSCRLLFVLEANAACCWSAVLLLVLAVGLHKGSKQCCFNGFGVQHTARSIAMERRPADWG